MKGIHDDREFSVGFQLTLGLKLSSKITLQNFIAGVNQSFIENLKNDLVLGTSFILYIWGGPNSGKSHLLQGACHELAYKGMQAGYLDLSCVKDLEILKGLEHLKMLAFDNYESLSPGAIEHLKRFIQSSWSLRRQILIAGTQKLPPVFQGIEHITSYELQSLSLEELKIFLSVKSEERGLCLPEDVQDFMVQHCDGHPEVLLQQLEKIEQRCDVEKKKLSLKFARLILTEHDASANFDSNMIESQKS